jgi:predicted dehydrogenase
LSVVAQNRFKPDIMRTKRMLETGALGELLFAQASSLWWRGGKYYDLWWRGTWEKEGGGCTFIHAVHQIDLFLWMMGEVKEVSALVSNLNHANSEVEDISVVTVRFASGALGSLVCSLLHHGEEHRLVMDFGNASIEIPHKLSVSKQMANGYPEPDDERCAELERSFAGIPEPAHTSHAGQIDDFLKAIEGDGESLVGGADGRRTIEFISAVYQSAFCGTKVALPLTAADPFYSRAGIMAQATRFHEKTKSVDQLADSGISVS